MSYEYMQGMMGLSGKLEAGSGQGLELVIEKCGSPGCIGLTPSPVIFKADHPNTPQVLANMSSRGCMLQCSKDDINYYCCPPRETSTAAEREARKAAACGGVGCVEPGLATMMSARTDSLKGQRRQENLLNQGCVSLCEEDGFAYFCCPGDEEVIEEIVEEPIAEELLTTTDVVAVEQESGSSAALIAILGLLGLGIVGFAGYWFLIRDKDEDEDEDEDEEETEDETEDEEEE